MKGEQDKANERSISFAAPMVLAVLDDSKTNTRRIINPQPEFCGAKGERSDLTKWGWHSLDTDPAFTPVLSCCPYGKPGDRLKVKEAAWMWCAKIVSKTVKTKKTGKPKVWWAECRNVAPIYCADHPTKPTVPPVHADNPHVTYPDFYQWRKKNARFMPAWARRITLEIVSIRIERLHDISEADALAEGIKAVGDMWQNYTPLLPAAEYQTVERPVDSFRSLWESINGPESWASNPFVWVITFRRVLPV